MKKSIIAITALLLLPSPRTSAQVTSSHQSGGVTANWVGTINQFVSAADDRPSLASELISSPASNGKFLLKLRLRNPTSRPINLDTVRYALSGRILGVESSFGKSLIEPSATIEIALAHQVSTSDTDLVIEPTFFVPGKHDQPISFRETFHLGDETANSRTLFASLHEAITATDKPGTLSFGNQDDLDRLKGEYIFTIPGGDNYVAYGGFVTPARWFTFDTRSNHLLFATHYKGKSICRAIPLTPSYRSVRRIRIYWDDLKGKGGMSVDGIEVTDANGLQVWLKGGGKCHNKPKSNARTLMKVWG